MKKLILLIASIITFCTLSASTINYYVDTTGVDTNDGLTETTPVTLIGAINLAVAEGTADTYIINVGKGQIVFNNLNVIAFDRTDDITLKIIGSSADSTYYQMRTDSAFNADIKKTSGQYLGRVFNNPRNTGTGSLTLEVEDFTFRNFGYTTTAVGALIQITTNGIVNFNMRRCVVERVCARSGSLVEAANAGDFSFTMEDCYFNEIYTCNNNLFQSPLVIKNQHSLTATNCVFSNFKKINPLNRTSYLGTGNKHGSVLFFSPTVAGASLTLINNTFIGDSAIVDEILGDQSTLFLNSTIADVPVTIANNIFIGGGITSPIAAFHDINVGGTTPTFTNSTNNVMNSHNGFVDAGNDSSSLYTYTSPEIDITLEDNKPKVFTTAIGVGYILAKGDSIVGQADVATQTTTDITGITRAIPGCIGAVEYIEDSGVPTTISKSDKASIKLYPNPVQDILHISAEASVLTVYNTTGQLVRSLQVEQGQVDLSTLTKGIYFVKVQDSDYKSLAIERIIKK